MLALIVASCITLAPPTGPATADEVEQVADLTEARRLFDEGLARYEAADYDGAIEVFTLALSEVRDQGVVDFRVRGLLLFNIGRAHTRAYEIDHKIEHLRQAQSIFKRFIEEANKVPDEVDEADVSEAQAQLAAIKPLLEDNSEPDDEGDEPGTEPMPPPPVEVDHGPEAQKLRARGIGLTVAGVALLGGGVGMLVWGTGYGPAAESQVSGLDDLGLPSDSPAFAEGDAFLAEERGKGTAWMAAGGVTAALGVVAAAIGIQQLVRSKRLENRSLTAGASFSRDGMGLSVSGRF